jgi:hypothetical protein
MIGDTTMFDNEPQYRELAQAIANQAQALADGKVAPNVRHAQAKLLQSNVETLLAWSPS